MAASAAPPSLPLEAAGAASDLHETAALHDHLEVLLRRGEQGDVLERITVDHKQIGVGAQRDDAYQAFQIQQSGSGGGGGADDRVRWLDLCTDRNSRDW